MGLSCGIVGLPNVGKSTLFNALTSTQSAEAANYPFCTIEPNQSLVTVPDERLNNIAAICQSAKIIPAQIEFVDIAGLVKGASNGEGLGNQFLGHIREVDAIAYVLRCFENQDIIHVEGTVDPIRDAEIIETELILADLESLERRVSNLEKKARIDKDVHAELEVMKEILPALSSGKPARSIITKNTRSLISRLNLLTSKPIFYICNVAEENLLTGNEYTRRVEAKSGILNRSCINISAKIESEIANLADPQEKQTFLEMIGLKQTGLNRVIQVAYSMLGLITYFTVGPKEARAWIIKEGMLAPQAAGVIHSDFERGFIRAEVIAYEDYTKYKSESAVKEAGKLRLEGKEILVKDGDIMHFRFNI